MLVTQSSLTLFDPMDCSLPVSSVDGIFQARILVAVAVAASLQSCPTLCDPMDCSLPGSSIHGIFRATVLEWGAILEWVAFPSPGDLPNSGTEPRSPALEADSLPSEPPGKLR